MNILLVSQHFWPESFIINDLVKTLVSQGHSVEVLTGKPNYPDGKIFDGYQQQGCNEELFDSTAVTIHRVPLYPRKEGSAKHLLRNYYSFIFNGLCYFHGQVKGRNFDLVFVFATSPIVQVIPAIYLKYRLKIPLVIWIQDLWPETLKAIGVIRNRLLLACVGLLVRSIYAFADTLLIQSKAFHQPVARYANPEKIHYYPNSCQDLLSADASLPAIPDSLQQILEQHFCLVFAGNLGKAQSLETLLRCAGKLRHLPEIRLVIVGSGSRESWLREQVAQQGLDNIILAGRFAAEQMPAIFSRAQGLLVSLNSEEIFRYTIPSKIQAYLAAGRPVIAALDGEGARIIEQAGAGMTCPAEDYPGLAQCIEQLYHMPTEDRAALGASGRDYYLEHFEMNKQAKRLVEILDERLAAGAAR